MKSSLHTAVSIPRTISSFFVLLFFICTSFSAKAQVILSVGNASGAQNVAIDVTVENWTDIIGYQFNIAYEADFLSLDSVGNFNLPSLSNANFNLLSDGDLISVWSESGLLSTNLTDGSTIFTLYFEVLQGGYTPIDITGGASSVIEIVGQGAILLPYVLNGGFVNGIGTTLNGNVFHDNNDDCMAQTGEDGLNNWIVKLNGVDRNFYTVTDANGDYSIFTDTGDYVVELIFPNSLWSACNNSVAVTLSTDPNTYTLDFPVQSIVDCPIMSVDISTPFLRRCFTNNYYVDYCNVGTDTAVDPYIEVELDEYMTFITSSVPHTVSPEGNYIFEVGDLDIGECSNFSIEIILDCDSTTLGQTHCVSAHAYPDSLCAPPNNSWSGASLQVEGDCVNDEIQLVIKNIGQDMIMESQYIVIEDAVMYAPDNFLLTSGGEMPLSFPANGSTYRLEVDQVEGHPGNSMPSLVIEGCGENSDGEFSLGFANQFSEDDNDSWISIDCQENIGSFDPNDKATSPEGYGPSHFIKPNVDIDYKIRFQNTGTDTAFNIVVEDTLSTLLNPATLRIGSSSHPYEFELTDEGLMRFTFSNIMLPDSNINEAASHGFIKFKIAQLADLPDGTIINNEAAIYFDFNEAIWTNNTFLEVQRNFLPVSTQEVFVEGVEVEVYPNPFSTTTTFEVKGKNYKAMRLQIFDSTGRLIFSKAQNSQPFNFSADAHAKGLYFYQIFAEDVLISTGKLIKQ